MRTTVLMVAAVVTIGATPAVASSTAVAAGRVCLTLSAALRLTDAARRTLLDEARVIWAPLGVDLLAEPSTPGDCGRIVMVRADLEALPEDQSRDAALGWVPFVNQRARRVVFLRVAGARSLISTIDPGGHPPAVTDHLTAKLLGRTLAHELGHLLLDSTAHDATGLMRARYRAHDVLRDRLSTYVLSAAQRDRLAARLAQDTP